MQSSVIGVSAVKDGYGQSYASVRSREVCRSELSLSKMLSPKIGRA